MDVFAHIDVSHSLPPPGSRIGKTYAQVRIKTNKKVYSGIIWKRIIICFSFPLLKLEGDSVCIT